MVAVPGVYSFAVGAASSDTSDAVASSASVALARPAQAPQGEVVDGRSVAPGPGRSGVVSGAGAGLGRRASRSWASVFSSSPAVMIRWGRRREVGFHLCSCTALWLKTPNLLSPP